VSGVDVRPSKNIKAGCARQSELAHLVKFVSAICRESDVCADSAAFAPGKQRALDRRRTYVVSAENNSIAISTGEICIGNLSGFYA
jgi:hypothetical protein